MILIRFVYNWKPFRCACLLSSLALFLSCVHTNRMQSVPATTTSSGQSSLPEVTKPCFDIPKGYKVEKLSGVDLKEFLDDFPEIKNKLQAGDELWSYSWYAGILASGNGVLIVRQCKIVENISIGIS